MDITLLTDEELLNETLTHVTHPLVNELRKRLRDRQDEIDLYDAKRNADCERKKQYRLRKKG